MKYFFKQRSWLLIFGGVAIAIIGISAVVVRRNQGNAYDVNALTVPVEATEVTIRVNASGEVEAYQTVNLSPKNSGIVDELLVEQGDSVDQGQVVARMDIDDLNAQLRQNQASLAEAEAQLQDLLQGTDQPQIAQAEANLEAVRAQLVDAEARLSLVQGDLGRDRDLYNQGAISARELDNSENAVDSAQANVRQLEARVIEAQQRLADLKDDPDPEDVAQARARIERARAQVSAIQTRIDNTIIRAPFAGVVTQKFATEGAFVTPTTSASEAASATSSAIVAIADGLEIVAEVPEADLGQIQVGQPAEITSTAYPEAIFNGAVRLIAPEAIERQNVTIFQVRIRLENGLEQLRSNMNVDVAFLGNRLSDALVVPAVAVVTQGGETGVLVPGENNRNIRFRPVTLGSQVGQQIQILDGVASGDRVFIDLPPGQTLDNLRFNRDEQNL
ncbi:rnd family efflux transporter mfp subunit [Leptolyngbya sp. Heron Island J]|uniref:efflux RND transporter periplasmic adaptor subunit n=1 Tax=Leptolyngbya sp. Heron Island J TaxID=1385935 RepID=UPI0003B98393|nr:efflux RND transporter periplasmic adaptor subunit [Leptolyngbya sp. Heron Island J]ESA32654.1 rnd family efflux transporter mfp subunit [Leptolyngbya sp. Heron Island J]